MTDLEVCKITAEMCGIKSARAKGNTCVIDFYVDGDGLGIWNPLTNAEQAMECLEELQRRGVCVTTHACDVHHQCENASEGPFVSGFEINCPPRELFARALAEIGKETT